MDKNPMDKDPFDEFEFKPLNEGIGFHKKSVQFKKELDVRTSMPSVSLPLRQPSVAKPQLPFHDFAAKPAKVPVTNQPIRQPALERTAQSSTSAPEYSRGSMQAPSAAARPFQPAPAAERPAIAPTQAVRPITPRVQAIEDVSVYVPAIIFDSIVVTGLTCLFAVAVLLVVQVDLLEVIQIAKTDFMTLLSLGLLAISVLELYLIIFRSFLGATLGEWAFDIQLGTKLQQASAYYPFRVILRSLVVIATGFITLPLLSFIIGRDLAGAITGLSLKRGEPIG